MSRWFPLTRFPFRGVVLYCHRGLYLMHVAWCSGGFDVLSVLRCGHNSAERAKLFFGPWSCWRINLNERLIQAQHL